jgi:DNA-binding response OmpR family regulator
MQNASKPTTGRPLVILIEDDNRLTPALAMLIEDWGYACHAARNPKTVVADLGSRLSEAIAIVVDLSRNDAFTGRRSAEAITAALGSSLPRLVTTNEPAMARTHGFSDVLAKPYDPETLRNWLAACLDRRAGQDACTAG